MDDSTIKGCIGGELEVEAALLKLKKIDDGLFSGRALKLVQYMNRQTLRKVTRRIANRGIFSWWKRWTF